METKHTQGEWKIDTWGHIVDEKGNGVLITGATIPMVSTEESCANAKLIAAAPELLEALKCIIDAEKKHNLEIPLVLHIPFMKAEQAIKKAT